MRIMSAVTLACGNMSEGDDRSAFLDTQPSGRRSAIRWRPLSPIARPRRFEGLPGGLGMDS
jgi:hypothetical protein